MTKELCAFENCKKKLNLTAIVCRCEKKFCNAHRYAEDHACAFDFQAKARSDLLKHMSTAISAKKIDVI